VVSSETRLDSTILTENSFWSSVYSKLLYKINMTIPEDEKQRISEHPNDPEALTSVHKLN
jgi:ppGpp synthetase/RelA/SpoT-type nucleotidyltranferase